MHGELGQLLLAGWVALVAHWLATVVCCELWAGIWV